MLRNNTPVLLIKSKQKRELIKKEKKIWRN